MGVPYPGLWESASNLAQGQLNAQMGAFSRTSHRETKRGQRYIRRLAHSFADELGMIGQGVGHGYDQVAAQQQASDAAIANFLQGGGEKMASNISGQLAFSPEAAAAQGGLMQGVGQAGGSMGAGLGGANMQNVLGEKASNRAYAKMLPGIAALSGIQEAGAFQQQQAADLKAQRDQLMGQEPTLTANLYSAFAQQRAAQQQMAQAERFHHEEMQASASAAAMDHDGENRARMNEAADQAQGLISTAMQGLGAKPTYSDLIDRVMAVYRQRFNRPDSWNRHQADVMLSQFGLSQMQDVGSFLHGMLPGGAGGASGSQLAPGYGIAP